MMAEHMLVFRNDLEARTAARMTSRDRARPVLLALVVALADAGRSVEAKILAAFFALDFGAATGETRDRWGKLIGETRGGLDEVTYRRWQEFRIRVNTDDATPPRLLALLALIRPDADTYELVPMPPNGLKGYVNGGPALAELERGHAEQLLRDYQPAGACWPVIEVPTAPFTFTTVFSASAGTTLARLLFGGR